MAGTPRLAGSPERLRAMICGALQVAPPSADARLTMSISLVSSHAPPVRASAKASSVPLPVRTTEGTRKHA